jgi:hypothetical protein
MTDPPDVPGPGGEPDEIDDTPTVACSRCSREWALDYELDELHAGNQAVEQFALDHERHTGHFPDDVRPWVADCRRCPDGDGYLMERPARRWAETHARHTGHAVELRSPDDGSPDEVIERTDAAGRGPTADSD